VRIFDNCGYRTTWWLLMIATAAATVNAQTVVKPPGLPNDQDRSMVGLGFITDVSGGWPVLKRSSVVRLDGRKVKRSLATNLMNLYNGQADAILRIVFTDRSPGKARIEQSSWVCRRAVYDIGAGRTASVTCTRLSPAVLLDSAGTSVTFAPAVVPDKTRSLQYIAFVAGGEVTVRAVADLSPTQAGELTLDEPWVLAWFGGNTPIRGFASAHDPTHLGDQVQFRKMQSDTTTYLDIPILFRFENRPSKIAHDSKGGILFVFPRQVGKLAVMPAFGGRAFPAETKTEQSITGPVRLKAETEPWKTALPEEVLVQCRTWSRALRDYPIDVEETYSIDRREDVLRIRQKFQWASFDDEWNTAPVRSAPIPPMLAVALRGNVAVTFWQDGKLIEPVNYSLMDVAGPMMCIEGGDSYEYRITGLGKYLWDERERRTPATAKLLKDKLESHVSNMVKSGHLAPLYYVHGYILDTRFSHFYWVGSPELAHALKMAFPHLSKDLQKRVKEYLASEWRAYPPFHLTEGMFTTGVPRQAYAIDRTNDFETPLPVERELFYRRQSFFFDLYRVNDYYSVLINQKPAKDLQARSAELAGSMVRRQDWAIMGPRRLDAEPGNEHRFYHLNGSATYNGWTAGAIGLARLGRRFGWHEEESVGWYLFGKLALARVAQAHYVSEMYSYGVLRGPAEKDDRCLLHIEPACVIVGRGALGRASFADQEFPPFVDIVEEVGLLLRDHAAKPCRQYLDHLDRLAPLWYLSEAPKQSATEQRTCPLYHLNGNVLAQYWILGKTGETLERYVDTTRFTGDLFYIQNLSMLLDSYAIPEQ